MNPGLRALRGGADGPAVDRYSLADPLDPTVADRLPVNRDKVRFGDEHRELTLQPRQTVSDDEPPADVRRILAKPTPDLWVKAHYADLPVVRCKIAQDLTAE